jgi:dTDP-4-amino-4,6-dideoxygalactose transaminase
VIAALGRVSVEARPVWKPMHLQRAFGGQPTHGGDLAARFFVTGLRLPSFSNLSDADLDEITGIVRDCAPLNPGGPAS